MLMTWLLVSGAFAGSKWEGENADVVAERVIAAPAEALFEPLTSLEVLQKIYPADCVKDWEVVGPPKGLEASGRLTYTFGPMTRRLTVRISKVEPSYNLELDHPEKKGFVVTWRLQAVDGGTKVTTQAWIAEPPKPFKAVYFTQVHPEWQKCYERALENLEAMATTSSISPPVPGPAPLPTTLPSTLPPTQPE